MKEIELAPGTSHVVFEDLPHLIALALWPEDEDDEYGTGYGCARLQLEKELVLAARNHHLIVRNPLTLGEQRFLVGAALNRSVVLIADLKAYVSDRGISVNVLPPERMPQPPQLSLLATRQELIDAFGSFTGMDASWFTNLKDVPALHAARKVTGQGGRGHIAEPLFCPLEVVQWLVSSGRRKGRAISESKAWEILEKSFPLVYNHHSVADPRHV